MTREVWVDYAKLLAIFLVIVGHAGLPESSSLREFVYSFHMPAFFIISGYLFKKTDIRFKDFIVKNIRQLIIPFLIFNLLLWLYGIVFTCVFDNPNIDRLFIKPFLGIILGCDSFISSMPNTPCWFLISLLVIKCVCYFVKINKTVLLPMLLSMIVALVINHYEIEKYIFFQLDTASLAFPFFILGMYLKKIDAFNTIFKLDKYLYASITIALFVVQLIIYRSIGFLSMYDNNYGNNIIFYYLISMTGSFFMFFLCGIFNPYRSVLVENYSNGTLLILGIHGLIMTFSIVFYKRILGFDYPNFVVAVVLSFIDILLLYYPIVWAMKHVPILVGKKK